MNDKRIPKWQARALKKIEFRKANEPASAKSGAELRREVRRAVAETAKADRVSTEALNFQMGPWGN